MENKVVLITGCSRGIGHAMVKKFAEAGAIVYANARLDGCLDEYATELNNTFAGKVYPIYFDIRNKELCKKAILDIKKQSGRLDVLINNAGILKDALLEMVDDATMLETFETNVFAVIHLTQFAVRLMKAQKGGCIINMSSILGVHGHAGQTVYSATKGAIITLTKTWAKELAPNGIRVNAIAPGNIETDMLRSVDSQKLEESLGNIGLKRFGTPEEVAEVAVMLASSKASYITGEILGVNGGMIV